MKLSFLFHYNHLKLRIISDIDWNVLVSQILLGFSPKLQKINSPFQFTVQTRFSRKTCVLTAVLILVGSVQYRSHKSC
jgi:hypothetical protein